jgi:hypothetical protein
MNQCRICLEEINDLESVYSPCNCRGSLNYIHIGCFNKAYLVTNKTKCEICNLNFPIWPLQTNTNIIFYNNDEINERRIENFLYYFYLSLRTVLINVFKKILYVSYNLLVYLIYLKFILLFIDSIISI